MSKEEKYQETKFFFDYIRSGQIDRIVDILDSAFDINSLDENGDSALHIAITENQPEICRFLMDRGIDILQTNNFGYNPLHYAILYGVNNIIRDLAAYSNLNGVDKYTSNTALHLAAQSGNIDAIYFLSTFSLNYDVKNTKGKTALHLAAIHRKFDIVELLISLGSNIFAIDNRDKTALDYVKKITEDDIIKDPRFDNYDILEGLKIKKFLYAAEKIAKLKNIKLSIGDDCEPIFDPIFSPKSEDVATPDETGSERDFLSLYDFHLTSESK